MTAVLATFVDFKTVRTRSVAQLVLEVPIEDADAALKALGGIPQPASERWVGVALAPKERAQEASKAKRAWNELSPTEQAGIRCEDEDFAKFLFNGHEQWTTTTAIVRNRCGVKSRAELNTDPAAAARWKALDAQFLEWQTTQRYEGSRTK